MNYYEELGVSEQATEQEIRKAHRRLVKLMHPDAQPDPALKAVAETQMRRLNSIVSTLLDPEQRRSYDRELQEANAPQRVAPPFSSWQGIPWWLASAVGAVALTLVVIWLWADHLGTTFSNRSASTVYIPPIESRPAIAPQNAPQSSLEKPAVNKGGISATVVSDGASGNGLSSKQDASSTIKSRVSDAPAPRPQPVIKPAAVVPPPKKQAAVPEISSPVRSEVRRAEPMHKIEVKNSPARTKQPAIRLVASPPERQKKTVPPPHLETAKKIIEPPPPERRAFSLPAGSLMARATPVHGGKNSLMPSPPGVSQQASSHDIGQIPGTSLPSATPPPARAAEAVLTAVATSGASAVTARRDPLEGDWVYAPKEPERRRAGFYPPEFIHLKLFGSGDAGSLKGQYSAKYLVTDKPVAPEVSFELASMTKGGRKFTWQSSTGARGTLIIDPIDERTIRIDWHTTTSTRAPALTSGQATLVRRQ